MEAILGGRGSAEVDVVPDDALHGMGAELVCRPHPCPGRNGLRRAPTQWPDRRRRIGNALVNADAACIRLGDRERAALDRETFRHQTRHPDARFDRLRRLASHRHFIEAGEARLRAERFLDAQSLVPFRHPFGARERTDLELSGAPADREMNDRHVLGLARTRRDDRAEAGAASFVASRFGFADRSRLVDLDQHRIDAAPAGRLADAACVGDEIIVADHLDAVADRGGELLEPFVVVLGERVFDRQDRIAGAPAEQHFGQRVAVELTLFEAKTIAAAFAEFRCGDVERDRHVLAWNKAGALDRPHQGFERFLIARKRRPPAAFIGHALQETALGHDPACGMIDFRRDLERLGEGFCARRDHHESCTSVRRPAWAPPPKSGFPAAE